MEIWGNCGTEQMMEQGKYWNCANDGTGQIMEQGK